MTELKTRHRTKETKTEENKLKISILAPCSKNKSALDRLQHQAAQICHIDSQASVVFLPEGPALDAPVHAITAYLPELVYQVQAEEKAGADAVVIAHYLDPGLDAARELVSIPVLGAGHTTFRLAAALARRFSIITTSPAHLGPIEDIIADESLLARIVSIKLLEGSQKDNHHCPKHLLELATEAVEKDGARLIVLALPDYNDWSDQVKEHLATCGNPVPVLDPVKVAIKHAENIAEMGMSQSKITYPTPEIRVYDGCLDF